jgi:AcrR family transcriptional regulator
MAPSAHRTASPAHVEGVLTPGDAWAGAPDRARGLFVAAVQAFAERGFHATTTRDVAQRAGLSPAGLYVHFASKEQLLYEICRFGHGRVLELFTQAAEIADPAERVATMARDSATFHAEHHLLARVNQNEFRAVAPDHLAEIVGLRRQIDALQRDVVRAGVREGVFAVDDVVGTSIALLTLGFDVARWFPTREIDDPRRVGDLYAELSLRMVGARA